MSKFGYTEITDVDELGRVLSIKESFSFGIPSSKVIKQSCSERVNDDKDVIAHFLEALKSIKSKDQRYLCFEVFTSDKDKSIHRVNIAHVTDK